MRVVRSVGALFVLVAVLGGVTRHAGGVRALLASTVRPHSGAAAHRKRVMLSACVDGFSSISPCTASASISVGDQSNKFFQFQNDESMDQDVAASCAHPTFATCTVTPSFQVIHPGHQGTIELTVTGTSGGKGVVALDAIGDGSVEATDTVTVNPIRVTPTDTIQQAPDTTYTQAFAVKNLGTVADTVNLSAGCSAGFTCSLLTATPMPLAANGSGAVNVSVTTTGAGTSGAVSLSAAPTHGVGGSSATVTVNIPVPLPPTVSVLPHNGYNHSTALCAASCFNVTAGYTTPAYTSMDVPRSVSLVYSSAMAYPLGVVQVNVKDPSFRLAQRISISAVRGGVSETFTNGTTELYVSQSSTDTSTKRLAAQLSTALATGIYHDTTTIKSRWTSGVYSGTVTQTSVATTLLIDNEQSSPYGSGWQIAGLQDLVFTSDSLSLGIKDGTGSILLFTRPTKTSPWASPLGDFTTLTTILNGGSVTAYHRTSPDGTILTFAPTGYLLGERNRFGDSTQYHYNGSNLLTAIVDPIGDSLTLAYTSGKLSTVTDPGGRVSHFTVDASGNLTGIKDATNTTTFGGTYDTHHRLTQATDRGGNTWLYRYDFASTIASDSTPAVLADGATKRLGTRLRSTLAAELIDTASHTGSSTTPAARVISDSVWAIVSPPGLDSVRFVADAFGAPTVEEDLSALITEKTTRNAMSQPTLVVGTVNGRTLENTAQVWSGSDETEITNHLAGTTVTLRYDSNSDLMTGAGGNTVPDTLYLNAAKTWADSEKIGGGATASVEKYLHDVHGRITRVTDPAGHIDSVVYAAAGFRNKNTSIAQNRATIFRYDRYGRADTVLLPGGAVVSEVLDSLGRVRTSLAPNGHRIAYAYDSLSNVRLITDATGQTYQFTLNALGWLVARINADTNHSLSARSDSFFYNSAGLVAKHRDRDAAVTTFTYDGVGRPATLTLADGRETRYAYDPNGLFATDSSAVSIDTVSVDSTGLLFSESKTEAGRTFTYVQTSDLSGLTRSSKLKQGSTVLDSISYGYDGYFRLDTLRAGGRNTYFSYANDGLLTSWKLPIGDSAVMTYNMNHQPITITYGGTGVAALNESLTRDTLDRVVQQRVSNLGDTVRSFAYDSLGRLTAYADSVAVDSLSCVPDPHGQDGLRCSPVGGWTLAAQSNYSYDSADNRRDLGATLTVANRLTSFNGFTLVYDSAGNLAHKSKPGFDQYFYWNSLGQLDSVLTNGSAVRFGYDGQGRRVRKSTAGQTLLYVYAGQALVAEIDSASGTAQKVYRYYPGVDEPHSVKEPTGTYYYISGIGSPGVIGLIDSTGLRDRYSYSPWGQLEDSLETVPNALKFAGREFDAETHLYFNHARYYDPQLARFISEDPLGQTGGINEYAYAGNDPVGSSDPGGTDGCVGGFVQYGWYDAAGGHVVAFDYQVCEYGDDDGGGDDGGGGDGGNISAPGGASPGPGPQPGPHDPYPHKPLVHCPAPLDSGAVRNALNELFQKSLVPKPHELAIIGGTINGQPFNVPAGRGGCYTVNLDYRVMNQFIAKGFLGEWIGHTHPCVGMEAPGGVYGQGPDYADAQVAIDQKFPSYVIDKDSLYMIYPDGSAFSCSR